MIISRKAREEGIVRQVSVGELAGKDVGEKI